MNTTYSNTTISSYKHLSLYERCQIELFSKNGESPNFIANKLGRNYSTIYRELARNQVKQTDYKNQYYYTYYAETAHIIYQKRRKNCGAKFKLLKDPKLINYIEKKILKDKWSPDCTIGRIKLDNLHFKTTLSTKTVYNYIDLGLLKVKNIDLHLKTRRKTKTSRIRKHKKILGTSIEERPDLINNRSEFGHWEIDTVLGKKTKGSQALLTLTERKVRHEIILPIRAKDSTQVIHAINKLKKRYGKYYSHIFKSITCDNGSEFSNSTAIEKRSKTNLYYAHPYSSFERGSNENHNGLIRRFIPKGKRIEDYSIHEIKRIEEWMNTLPRKILGYYTPKELFEKNLECIMEMV